MDARDRITEKAHAPPRVRALPGPGTQETELAAFRVWTLKHAAAEADWWNNVKVSLELIRRAGTSLEDLYTRLDAALFADFQKWKGIVPIIDIQDDNRACSVLGAIRRVRLAEKISATVDLEDVLLHAHAYACLLNDVVATEPHWLPFFFRGGVAPGVEVLAQLMGLKTPAERLAQLHWLPGLHHHVEEVGCDPKAAFRRVLADKMAATRPGAPFHIWIIDTTLTGSTALTGITSALEGFDARGRVLDVTFAALLPIEENVKRKIATLPVGERQALPWRSYGNLPVFVHRALKPKCVRAFEVRLYPVAQSLTDDRPEIVELDYLAPSGDQPRYGLFLRDTTVTIRGPDGKATSRELAEEAGAGGRADNVHDWIFNVSNPQRLERVLGDLGWAMNVPEAVARLLEVPAFRAFAAGPFAYHLECDTSGGWQRLLRRLIALQTVVRTLVKQRRRWKR